VGEALARREALALTEELEPLPVHAVHTIAEQAAKADDLVDEAIGSGRLIFSSIAEWDCDRCVLRHSSVALLDWRNLASD
jgi:hypothetical protein